MYSQRHVLDLINLAAHSPHLTHIEAGRSVVLRNSLTLVIGIRNCDCKAFDSQVANRIDASDLTGGCRDSRLLIDAFYELKHSLGSLIPKYGSTAHDDAVDLSRSQIADCLVKLSFGYFEIFRANGLNR